jgi:hypothetical protein
MDEEQLVDQFAEMLRLHRGKANAIKSAEIARSFHIPDNDTTRRTRVLVKKAMRKHGLAIGGLMGGYFIVETPEELAECALDLQNRIDGIEDRLALLKSNYYNGHGRPADEEDEDEAD